MSRKGKYHAATTVSIFVKIQWMYLGIIHPLIVGIVKLMVRVILIEITKTVKLLYLS
jgi:hypothetical protein